MMHTSSAAIESRLTEADLAGKEKHRNLIRVLLIEDNRSDVFLVSRMLRDASREDMFEILDVPRLSEALTTLDGRNFDIALLDLNLLDMEGVASVAALHTEAPDMPIIVYSGTHDPKMRHAALMCGAAHFLVKGRESAFSLRFMLHQALSANKAATQRKEAPDAHLV